MRVYVASSWRNEYQPRVVSLLRGWGHDVYDFKNPTTGGPKSIYAGIADKGFAWSDIDPDWESWTPKAYRDALNDHPLAKVGFLQDLSAMEWADAFVLVQPCGRSAHLELGWAIGAEKYSVIYFPDGVNVEPELMAKLASDIVL